MYPFTLKLPKLFFKHALLASMALVIILPIYSCKKEAKQSVWDNDLKSLVFNLGAVSTYNREKKEVTVKMADYIDKDKLVAIFQLSEGAIAKVNGVEQMSHTTENDFTNPVTYTIVSKDGKSSNWTVKMESNNSLIGLGNVMQAEKRLLRTYEWYQSQDTSGSNSLVNGGPACLAMALNYVSRVDFAHLTAKKVREDAIAAAAQTVYKTLFNPVGNGTFSSIDMADYLNTQKSVIWKVVKLSTEAEYSEITDCIDKGYVVIALTDMSHIGFNLFPNQHTSLFYKGYPMSSAGHYFVIKGYKKVDGNLWYEVYDPYTLGQRYTDGGEIKGRNRYYFAESVRKGGVNGQDGWGYVFVLNHKVNWPFEAKLKNEVTPEEMRGLMERVPRRLWGYGY